ncbi:TPA: CHAP domain-containing protein, partial [Streptococcus equi subsp. zooepidemicus]
KGAVVSTAGGFDGTYPQWGHVGIVEVVNPDGSFLVSELNYAGIQDSIHYRVCQSAPFYSFATPR